MIAERDFLLERRVIQLIGLEIILNIVFGIGGIYESWNQGDVLDHMDKRAAATAHAMKAAKSSLEALADDQAKSLDRLKE